MEVLKILGKCFSVIYSVIYAFALYIFVIILFITTLISTSFMVEVIKSVDLADIKIADTELSSEYAAKYGEDATLEDVVVGEMVEVGIEENSARELVNDENIREFLGEKIGELIDNSITGNDVASIEEKDMQKALVNISLTEEEVKNITDFLNDFIDEYNKGGIN